MDIRLLKTILTTQSESLPTFLIFNDEEAVLSKQYLNSYAEKAGGLYAKRYDTTADAHKEITTNFKDEFVYVIMNDLDVLKDPTTMQFLINTERKVILYYNKLDKTNKALQPYKEYIVDFKKLSKNTILAYLEQTATKAGITVPQEHLITLIDYCNEDLGCCLNELDKIIVLGQASSGAVFEYMLNKGFSDYRQTNLFNFIFKVLDGDKSIFDSAQRLDGTFIGLVFNLYKQARNKALKCTTSNEAVKYTDIMQLCSTLDSGIKDGTISDSFAQDYLLVKAVARCQ